MLFEPRVIKAMRREGIKNPRFARKAFSICWRHRRRREKFFGEKQVVREGRIESVGVNVLTCVECGTAIMEAVPESPFAWDPPFETRQISLY